MPDRRYESSLGDRESIDSQFDDWGISGADELRDFGKVTVRYDALFRALEPQAATQTTSAQPQATPAGGGGVEEFFGDDFQHVARPLQPMEKAFLEERAGVARLHILSRMGLREAIECVAGTSERAADYLRTRLAFYAACARGEPIRHMEGSYVRESYATEKEHLAKGLWRDTMYAAMIGTPELAISTIAQKRCEARGIQARHLPQPKGCYSGILPGRLTEGNTYQALSEAYQRALAHLRRRAEKEPARTDVVVDGDALFEHRAVMLAASWIVKGMEYNDPDRSPGSSYVCKLEETTAWARLGNDVQRQLRGMRQKIEGVNLRGIDRFIGKSGDSRYAGEKRKIDRLVKQFDDPSMVDAATVQRLNDQDCARAEQEAVQKRTVLARQYERKRARIAAADLPDEERDAQAASADAQYAEALAALDGARDEQLGRLGGRTAAEAQHDLHERRAAITERYEEAMSPAQKAIAVHFALCGTEEDRQKASTDWINTAPFGRSNWAHTALRRGVSKEAVRGYALAREIFGEATLSREILRRFGTFGQNQIYQLKEVRAFCAERGILVSPDKLVRLTCYTAGQVRELIDVGYSIDTLVAHPWLKGSIEQSKEGDLFPANRPKWAQESWCVQHAFSRPGGWQAKRLGGIILSRLNAGIDATLHDATFWLREFEVPTESDGKVYRDEAAEIELLCAMLDVPPELQRRIPTKPQKYTQLFSTEATELIYEALLPLVGTTRVDLAALEHAALAKIAAWHDDPTRASSLKEPLPELEKRVRDILRSLRAPAMIGVSRDVPALVGVLRAAGEARTKYVDVAQRWVQTHASAPRDLLVMAWANRDLALADGCADNPRAIKQWADMNSLRAAYVDMRSRGDLPKNFEQRDLHYHQAWLRELVRCYDGRTAIQTVARLKTSFNPACELPPMRIDLGEGWAGEVLLKNDPRGATIGHDTGCCMTLHGASSSCIEAGYTGSPYGFFVLTREDAIVGQSFLYTNATTSPETIVCDNIETNAGRDRDAVLQKYQLFFSKYLAALLRRKSGAGFTRVHVGTGYSDVGLSELRQAPHVGMPDGGIYTDAHSQKELLELAPGTVEKLRRIETRIARPDQWETLRADVLAIEEGAFAGKGYAEAHLRDEFTDPRNVVVTVFDGAKVIGYSTAIADRAGTTLYVSSTAIHPAYQKRGIVADLMVAMDAEARRRGYQYYERDSRTDNGYAAKLKRNYVIVEEGEPCSTSHGMQQHLKMEIPDRGLPQTLSGEIRPRETPKEGFAILGAAQAKVVAALESRIYPPALQQGVGHMEEELSFAVGDEYQNASSLLRDAAGEAIGYIIAYRQQSETGHAGPVLYVSDFALLPEYQGSHGRILLRQLLLEASRHRLPLEFHARDETSYRAVRYLERLGFRVTSDTALPGFFAEDGVSSPASDVHLVRLENEAYEKKLAA